ncbi:hypothetical protein F4778DRAFT_725105 [Xylariomycetidae sp. FL2044]|nr:hypothetical protein F4778DRAFT_725105 [Xylariomycetidae sp. FL2044]
MSHPSSTPANVPVSAASYTPATLDPELRSQINVLLLQDGHITKIQDYLLHSLNSHSANWPSAIQSHALTLLRSGEVSTFPALIRRVLEDVRRETTAAQLQQAAAATATAAQTSNDASTNATADASGNKEPNNSAAAAITTNGNVAKSSVVNGSVTAGNAGGEGSLAIPTAVVESVLKVTRESLDTICEFSGDSGGGGGGGGAGPSGI